MNASHLFTNAGMLAAVVLAALLAAPLAAPETLDPEQLQERGLRSIREHIDHFRRTGDFQSRINELLVPAEQDLIASHTAFSARGDPGRAAVSLVKLGDIKRMQGQWQPAVELYHRAISAATAANQAAPHSEALKWLAMAEKNLRDYGGALEHVERAIELSSGLEDKKYLVDALGMKSQILVEQGDLAAAADSATRALAMAPQVGEDRLFFGHLDLGGIYRELGWTCDTGKFVNICLQRLDLATAQYREARALAEKMGWAGLSRLVDDTLAGIAMKRRMYSDYTAVIDKLKSLRGFNPEQPQDVLVNEAFAREGDPKEAQAIRSTYAQSKRVDQVSEGFAEGQAALTAHLEGQMRKLEGDSAGALESFLEAVELVEKDRGRLNDENARSDFLKDKMNYYHLPTRELLQQKRIPEAFALLERSKARAMSDLLASKDIRLGTARHRDLYAGSITLRAEIASHQHQLFGLAAGGAEKEGLAGNIAAIQRLEEQYRVLTDRITSEAPKVKELVAASPATLEQLQRAMREDRFEVLQYLVQSDGVILWHISADAVNVRTVFIPRELLSSKVASLKSSLADRHAGYEVESRQLFLFLIQPALGWIKTDRVVVIPHAELHGLPFQVLTNPADGSVFGERFQLSYAPSASVLLQLKPPGSIKGAKLLAIADPAIPPGLAEVKAISNLYPRSSTVIRQALAKEGDVKAMVAGYDVVHLSVHGEFKGEGNAALFSHLKFSPDGQNDGALTAAEMFGLPLDKARLVVLSACEAGKAQVTNSDELIGIVRALLYAGARSLIVSQWKIDDEATALWMQTFYREAQTKPVPEAARLALLKVKAHAHYSHPYYWAAFTVVAK